MRPRPAVAPIREYPGLCISAPPALFVREMLVEVERFRCGRARRDHAMLRDMLPRRRYAVLWN